jgi:hypothetical protein
MATNIDRISYRGMPHLADRKSNVSYCKKTAPIWYRTPWKGASKGICKNCINALIKKLVQEQNNHVSPVP